MKEYWGVDVRLHAFMTSALGGGTWSASSPGRFTPSERVPDTHWIGGWVGSKANLDAVVKRKICKPLQGLEPPIIQPVVVLLK
jgi:hypothetical protein